ncbi:DNA methyltransferase [uncultured Aquimonas sp.]|uniref:class I SAM-dependent DNA methyltransferase n=1 Tax=uncultured Aquimonas sp. TaxID=385483 RepID=UPI00086BCAFA|nr:DNA methyltransferase [uncultured Aquimonas sp.]ODU46295.1 MAG: DNA methyltransferase [Xanthomonadaceae bacterium SCN 69-123]
MSADTHTFDLAAVEAFIAKWNGVNASELSTSQSFLIDLCHLLGVDTPHPTAEQNYMFERPISFSHGDGSSSAGRIDLYRRGAFVLESKKLRSALSPKGFDHALLRARSQAEAYARALPASEGRPPFVLVVDVGQRIELYSEFSRSGATYTPFPDPRSHRIALTDLRRPELLARLRRIWLDPMGLDPSRESARVTREIAAKLAKLARSLEASGHPAEAVAQFLMRCLFTMFAEDVRLLPAESFRNLLKTHVERPDTAMRMLAQLWRDMDSGGFSPALAADVLHFNGKLFKDPSTLPLDRTQIELLIEAARADWRYVEPAIFGTLLERALDPTERHKLGAHYTPRAYVERLVLPTVIEPLREEWAIARAASGMHAQEAAELGERLLAKGLKPRQFDALKRQQSAALDAAAAELRAFHHRLCSVRVLDPACGSGNFLYVTLEHLKRLEGEVLNALDDFGDRQTGLALGSERADAAAGETVDPHNLLGIELNPRAAAIAEVVLWIGYLQWHFRTQGDIHPPQPVIRDFRTIENRDAVLAYDRVDYARDAKGEVQTRWDGRTMKPSPVTGEPIPDEAARVPIEVYVNPRKAAWPEADFVVGNPPFIGNKRMRIALGDGYVEALRAVWSDVPESADLVMYWWHHAAQLTRRGALKRFGLITTNSIRQAFNRRIIEAALAEPSGKSKGSERAISLVFAIPDHPWVDTADGAAVRIAMTVAEGGRSGLGRLLTVVSEEALADGEVSVGLRSLTAKIHADLAIGANVSGTLRLDANSRLACPGVQLSGQGFVLARADLDNFSNETRHSIVRPYLIGSDLAKSRQEKWVIDTFGLDENSLLSKFPDAFQWLKERVFPERQTNPRATYRTYWWRHAEPRSKFRTSLVGLSRFIATSRTARHRCFQFLPAESLPETKVLLISLTDASYLGILSSVVHTTFAEVAGGHHGVGNDLTYNHSDCFEKFPFPTPTEAQAERIRALAEQLDAHRKRQQAAHPGLTLTGMYNVLEALREGRELSAKERGIHGEGLVSVLRQIHDELDAAVLEAYSWADLLPDLRIAHGLDAAPSGDSRVEARRRFDEAVLERLVALNAERAAEEARGLIRWLRPEYQNPDHRDRDTPNPATHAASAAAAAPAVNAEDAVGSASAITSDSTADAQAAGAAIVGAQHSAAQASLLPTAADGGTDEADASGDDSAADSTPAPLTPIKAQPWPRDTVDQIRAIADLLLAAPAPLSLDQIAAHFSSRGPWKNRLPQLIDMLLALGRAEAKGEGYVGRR